MEELITIGPKYTFCKADYNIIGNEGVKLLGYADWAHLKEINLCISRHIKQIINWMPKRQSI